MPPRLEIPTLDDLSKHFAPIPALKKVRGPRSLRRSLRDANGIPISQAQLGGLLANFRRRGYSRRVICNWERLERGKSLPRKYIMADRARAAYYALLFSLVAKVSDGRLYVKARMGKRVWRFELRASCKVCSTKFKPKTVRSVRCWRCRRR